MTNDEAIKILESGIYNKETFRYEFSDSKIEEAIELAKAALGKTAFKTREDIKDEENFMTTVIHRGEIWLVQNNINKKAKPYKVCVIHPEEKIASGRLILTCRIIEGEANLNLVKDIHRRRFIKKVGNMDEVHLNEIINEVRLLCKKDNENINLHVARALGSNTI